MYQTLFLIPHWSCCFFQDSNVKGLIAVVLRCLPAHASSLSLAGLSEDGGQAYLGCGFATSDSSYSLKEFGTKPPRNQTCLWRTLPGPRTFLISQEFSGGMVTVPPYEVTSLGPVGFLSLADPALGNCALCPAWNGLFRVYSRQALTITIIGFPPCQDPLPFYPSN